MRSAEEIIRDHVAAGQAARERNDFFAHQLTTAITKGDPDGIQSVFETVLEGTDPADGPDEGIDGSLDRSDREPGTSTPSG